ncbi:MAG: ankyrin repeat domain-containing protein [Puniceicoccales bacterium]|nr:ankyrin repeat domain-containing protein [Puniceicoccales bacterium]
MKKFKISSLLLGTFLMPMVSYGTADFGEADGQFADVVVSDDALFEAIDARNINLVNYLLDHGADVNAIKKHTVKYDTYENTPLSKSILRTKNIDMVRLLLDRGANVNIHLKSTNNDPQKQWDCDYATPLTKAVMEEDISVVHLLLDRGADVNACLAYPERNDNGEQFGECDRIFTRYSCPLIYAIRWHIMGWQNIEMVRLLLEWGANVNTEDGATLVPLIAAVETGDINMVRLLLEQDGIDVNATHDVTPTLTWDEYEAIRYGGGTSDDFNRQEPITALQAAGSNDQIAQLLRAYGAM